MNLIKFIIENKLYDAKIEFENKINSIVNNRLNEAKDYVRDELNESELLDEKNNSNVINLGRTERIRRRLRRNSQGKIVIQKNRRQSTISGYRISGNSIKRISATDRLSKSRKLKTAWKTHRRANLKRALIKRRITMRRRSSLGL